MPSRALLSKTALMRNPGAADAALPVSVADLDGFELVVHCDRCGRHHRLHPGIADLAPRARLSSLLQSLLCRAQRAGRLCGGRPRRLILTRDDRRWVLEPKGEWVEDDSAFWEEADFEPIARRRRR